MKRPLSKRQQTMLSYIKDFMGKNSYPPTVRDIQTGCEISSTSVVDYNLQILQREGYLQRRREVSRGIELLGETATSTLRNLISIPVVGMGVTKAPWCFLVQNLQRVVRGLGHRCGVGPLKVP